MSAQTFKADWSGGMADLPAELLARIFAFAGQAERQCQLVCRRWWHIWWTSPELWCRYSTETFDRKREREDAVGYQLAQLAALQRVGRLVEEADLRGVGTMLWDAAQPGPQWWLLDALGWLAPERLRSLRLWTEKIQSSRCLLSSVSRSTFHTFPSLHAAAAQRLGRYRRLESLELSSWQLPHSAVRSLARLTSLRSLSLRARQLPHGTLPTILLHLTGLTHLSLKCTMELGPLTAGLTQLQQLQALELFQLNTVGAPLVPPSLDCLPHLEHYSFINGRGQVLVPGSGLNQVHYMKSGHAGGAVLELNFSNSDPPVDSLQLLLHSLLPPGARLTRLKASLMATSTGALRHCSHLSALQALELNCLECEDEGGDAAGLAVLLQQARGLTQLQWSSWNSQDDATKQLPTCLADYGGLRCLSLGRQALADLPPGCAWLPTIEQLHLNGNDFEGLPLALAAANSLRTLRLDCNHDLQMLARDVDLLLALPALQELDLRGTGDCRWPADLIRLARRPGLTLHADNHRIHLDGGPVPYYAFDDRRGPVPWEVERWKQQVAAAEERRKREEEQEEQEEAPLLQPAAGLQALQQQDQLQVPQLARQEVPQGVQGAQQEVPEQAPPLQPAVAFGQAPPQLQALHQQQVLQQQFQLNQEQFLVHHQIMHTLGALAALVEEHLGQQQGVVQHAWALLQQQLEEQFLQQQQQQAQVPPPHQQVQGAQQAQHLEQQLLQQEAQVQQQAQQLLLQLQQQFAQQHALQQQQQPLVQQVVQIALQLEQLALQGEQPEQQQPAGQQE